MYKIAVFVGSLRRDSINRKLAKALAVLGKDTFSFHFVELSDVPMYNEDLWQDPPASVLRLKSDIAAADAVLFVTPEYNRSLPAVIKNALDWGTRPWGQNSWAGKPAAIAGTALGAIGTAVAQAQFRSIAATIGLKLMGQPEVYLTFKPELIDGENKFTDASTRAFLEKYLTAFEDWVKNHGAR